MTWPKADTDGNRSFAAPFIKGDWNKSVFLPDPHIDNLMSALLHLGGEMWTMRRRLLVVEALLDRGGIVDRAAIEAFVPDDEEQAGWERERDDFIDRVFGVLVRETADVRGSIPKVPA